ncbi:MAG: ABC transporter ATP-binding protein, partial [Muribaculaceae bacterium]|nr:ABC transporter ATP-binding protein [Muribaculaceae bacterium]
DMTTKDILIHAIRDFDGTVIVVSHDREFLDGLVTKVYEFGGGRVRECLGGIYEFLEKKRIDSLQELERNKPAAKEPPAPAPKVAKEEQAAKTARPAAPRLSYAEQREREKAVKRAAKRVEEAETQIAAIEERIAAIEADIAAGNTPADIYDRHAAANKELENAMSHWELAGMELEELKQRYGLQ